MHSCILHLFIFAILNFVTRAESINQVEQTIRAKRQLFYGDYMGYYGYG